jgi:putative transposase
VTVFRFIAAERVNHPVSLMCRVLEVSRSGFHAWERRRPSRRAQEDAQLVRRIEAIHARSRATYGAPRVHAELRSEGVRVSRKRVERLMRGRGLSGLVRRRRGKTTVRVPGVRVAEDLVRRDFRPARPNALWVADLTYVRTWEGWLYLAVVLDCFSRRVVGWAIDERMDAGLVVDALEMAVWNRRPAPGLVHHSDHGSQYVSLVFGRRCEEAGIQVSMGAQGSALDNAVCESFFSSLKKELLQRCSWPTRQEARTAVFEWVEGFYNRTRRHSSLGYLSPVQFEERSLIEGEREEAMAA